MIDRPNGSRQVVIGGLPVEPVPAALSPHRPTIGDDIRLPNASLRVHVAFSDPALTVPRLRIVVVDGQVTELGSVAADDIADVALTVVLWRWLRFVAGADDFYVVSEVGLSFDGELEDLELVGGLALLPQVRRVLSGAAGPHAAALSNWLEERERA
ncbi:MAG: hypothetical protein U0Q22_15095 [Acidimicrobiales bacterium]